MSTAATPQRTERAGVLPSSRRGPAFRSDAAPDRLMRRLLGVGDRRVRPSAEAHRAFRVSVVVSAVRCLITYVFLPLLAPLLKVSGTLGPVLGLVLGAVSMVAIVVSMRRFFAADHKYRWGYAAVGGGILVLLVVAGVSDVASLVV